MEWYASYIHIQYAGCILYTYTISSITDICKTRVLAYISDSTQLPSWEVLAYISDSTQLPSWGVRVKFEYLFNIYICTGLPTKHEASLKTDRKVYIFA